MADSNPVDLLHGPWCPANCFPRPLAMPELNALLELVAEAFEAEWRATEPSLAFESLKSRREKFSIRGRFGRGGTVRDGSR